MKISNLNFVDCYSEVTGYTVLAYSVFMTHMDAKVTPTDNTDDLFNQSYSYIGSTHTHTHTHTCTHMHTHTCTHARTQAILRNQVRAWFKN